MASPDFSALSLSFFFVSWGSCHLIDGDWKNTWEQTIHLAPSTNRWATITRLAFQHSHMHWPLLITKRLVPSYPCKIPFLFTSSLLHRYVSLIVFGVLLSVLWSEDTTELSQFGDISPAHECPIVWGTFYETEISILAKPHWLNQNSSQCRPMGPCFCRLQCRKLLHGPVMNMQIVTLEVVLEQSVTRDIWPHPYVTWCQKPKVAKTDATLD